MVGAHGLTVKKVVPFVYIYTKCHLDTSIQSKQPSEFQLIFPNETKLAFYRRVLNVRQMLLMVTFRVECSTNMLLAASS